LRLRYIANFTDFDPFLYEPDVEMVYSLWEGDIENADLVIIPGSKNTVKDLLFLRESGIEGEMKQAAKKGTPLMGICGGYQMLGNKIYDPHGVESDLEEMDGLGLLDIESTFQRTKLTSQVEAELDNNGMFNAEFSIADCGLKGYEIHMGVSKGDIGLFRLKRISSDSGSRMLNSELILDGSVKDNVWGTYIHGIFDNDRFRRTLLNSLRVRKGLRPIEEVVDYSGLREDALNEWARTLKENIDIKFIEGLISG